MSEKEATLPAPSLRSLAKAAELEINRLEAISVREYERLREDVEEVYETTEGKDGEFASVEATTLARLESNAPLMYVNSVHNLWDVKTQVSEELQRRNAGDLIAEAEV
jgi:hypothetical protein